MTRMLFAALALVAAPAVAQPQVVEVALSDFKFTPAALTLHHGTPYRLRFVNVGSGGHNFSGKGFFAALDIDPADRAKVEGGKVEVKKGAAVDLAVMPRTIGRYDVKCTHFLHAGFGMKGTATID